MITTLHNDPFPHVVYEDFFNNDELEILKPLIDETSKKLGNQYINKKHGIYNELLQDKAYDIVMPVFEQLKEITPYPSTQYSTAPEDTFFRIKIWALEPGFTHTASPDGTGIHCDDSWKQMTTVVYLSNKSAGTHLYRSNKQEDYAKTIDWEFNKGHSFISSKDSWHNFEHPKEFNESRVTLMFLLANKRYYG